MAGLGQSATPIGAAGMEELASIPDTSEDRRRLSQPSTVGRVTSATGVSQ
jgi:spore maturation protein SpmA